MLNTILLLATGLGVLIAGGDFLVRGATSLAQHLRLSSLVIGLTVVSMGTSAPELIISIQSALAGSPDLATGNVVGSNICNLALVLGLMSVLNKVPVSAASIRFDWPMTMAATLLFYIVALDRMLGRLEGVVLLALLAIFITVILRNSLQEFKLVKVLASDQALRKIPTRPVWKSLVYLSIGVVLMYYGSEWFVVSARSLAVDLGISERIVGLTVVAVGTSLPELVTSISAAVKKETDMALGNLLGSNIFNSLAIMGITGLIVPVRVNQTMLNNDMLWMLSITLVLLPLMLIKRDVSRIDGVVLLAMYGAYLYLSVFKAHG